METHLGGGIGVNAIHITQENRSSAYFCPMMRHNYALNRSNGGFGNSGESGNGGVGEVALVRTSAP